METTTKEMKILATKEPEKQAKPSPTPRSSSSLQNEENQLSSDINLM